MGGAVAAKARMQGPERRELIALEAGRLFGRLGYGATRLDDIAAAAGVTKPIVYRHFGSKKDLYIALLRRHEADLPTFIDVELTPGMTHEEFIGSILDGWLDYAHENSWSWLILFRDKTGDPEIEAARVRVNARAHEILTDFTRRMAPKLSPELVEPSAEFLTRGLAGLVLWWADHPGVRKAVVHAAATRICVATLRE
ncbi:MAG: TetR/AcrR family transcriptional regulator [Solirubrobacterales bacterium]